MDEIEDERLEEALRARRNLGVTQDVLHEHEAVSFNEAFVVERHRGGWSDSALGRVEEPAQVAREDVAVVSHVANPVPASAIRSTFTLGLALCKAQVVAGREGSAGRIVRGDGDDRSLHA